jgi:hypothetical protein
VPFGEKVRKIVEGPRAQRLLGTHSSRRALEAQEPLGVLLVAEKPFLITLDELPGYDAFAFDELGQKRQQLGLGKAKGSRDFAGRNRRATAQKIADQRGRGFGIRAIGIGLEVIDDRFVRSANKQA